MCKNTDRNECRNAHSVALCLVSTIYVCLCVGRPYTLRDDQWPLETGGAKLMPQVGSES